MKTIFFKIVLPAFAFMIAIIASLAFTSNANDEDALVTVCIWDDTVTPQVCIEVDVEESLIEDCHDLNFGVICTAEIVDQYNNPKDLYSRQPCNRANLLRRP